MNENIKPVIMKRKKTNIIWILTIIGILILSTLFIFYYNASKELVPILKVNVDVEGTDTEPEITTIEYSQEKVPRTHEPKETDSHIPGIYFIIYGKQGERDYFQPYSKWTSTSFQGKGKYGLTAGFQFQPEKAELLKIQIKIVNPNGESIAIKDFIIVWDYEAILDTTFDINESNSTYLISNPTVEKSWVDPDSITNRTSDNIPGIYFIIENKDKQLNYITSVSFNGKGQYKIRAYLIDRPKIGETLKLKIIIKDPQGNLSTEYPDSGKIWNIAWV